MEANVLRISLVLMALLPKSHGAEWKFYRSDVNPHLHYLQVDGCKVPIMDVELKNECYVMKKVNEMCNLHLNLDECYEK
jgi:hypothetical protein